MQMSVGLLVTSSFFICLLAVKVISAGQIKYPDQIKFVNQIKSAD